MVSEHAMLILMLLLAIAVVLLAISLTLYVSRLEMRLKCIGESIEQRSPSSGEVVLAE